MSPGFVDQMRQWEQQQGEYILKQLNVWYIIIITGAGHLSLSMMPMYITRRKCTCD